jgi:DNA-binding MarR family transcriptional regulator/transcriptional regulator with XRE-family HTH domain
MITRNNRAIEINDKLLFSFIEHNWPNEAPTVFEIAGRLDRHVGNMYAQIKRLENRGWVDRILVEGERRERVRIIARPSEPPQPAQAEKYFSKHQVALVERQERKSAQCVQREHRREGILRLRNEYRMTLDEIGQALGISRQRVQKIIGSSKIERPKAKKKKLTEGEKFYRRFWGNIDVRGKYECWEWTAGKAGVGYGRFRLGRKSLYAHRVMYEIKSGEKIPPGMVVMHTCDNPGCVSPEHLVLGTTAENMRDRDTKGRNGKVRQADARDKNFLRILQETEVDGLTVRELAERLGNRYYATYSRVRRLQSRGLIRVERNNSLRGCPGLVYARPA